MGLIFISYFHEDRDPAFVVKGHLSEFDVFIDEEDLRAGYRWRDEIRLALDTASALVVLCTSRSMASTEVLFEVAYAMGRRIRVIPVCWERVELPSFLATLQFLDFSHSQKPWLSLTSQLASEVQMLRSVDDKARQCGLLDIGRARSTRERTTFCLDVLSGAKPGSTVLAVGRSLVDLTHCWQEIEKAIRDRCLQVKMALLDVNTMTGTDAGASDSSWIEKPIPTDWAMKDVPASMDCLRRIQVGMQTGSLAVYGLPFYVPNSFLAYTKESDGHRYCLLEAGMATDKAHRPYLEFLADDATSFGGILEWMNEALMTPPRLLLLYDGSSVCENDTTHRGKILAGKIERLGMVDLASGRHERDWLQGDVGELISQTPASGEIFIVGRSLVIWANNHRQLAEAVINRKVKCTFVIADPTLKGLKSLVSEDYAMHDLQACWRTFRDALVPEIERRAGSSTGTFEVYGIPTYTPVTFACYTGPGGVRFCSLEVGIGVGPNERPSLYFRNVGESDIYSRMNAVFRKIIEGREPLVRSPSRAHGDSDQSKT